MGDVAQSHIVVTGANGYLGRAIVALAVAQGHRVTKIVRSGAGDVVQDLALDGSDAALLKQIESADAVVHAASEMSSDWDLQERSTLPATRNICAFAKARGAHLVHISSIAVYDFAAIAQGDVVHERSPLEIAPEQRDGYMRAKLAQEEIIAEQCPQASVLRVGAIYGPSRIMNAHLGIGVGPVLLRLAAHGQIPLAHVDLTAQIALSAALKQAGGAVNVLDTDLPDRVRFIAALEKSGWPKLVIPLPWQVFSGIGALLAFWAGRPGLFKLPILHARMKPLGYDNSLMRSSFGDAERPSFEALMKRAMQDD